MQLSGGSTSVFTRDRSPHFGPGKTIMHCESQRNVKDFKLPARSARRPIVEAVPSAAKSVRRLGFDFGLVVHAGLNANSHLAWFTLIGQKACVKMRVDAYAR